MRARRTGAADTAGSAGAMVDEMLRARGITPRLNYVGNYFTSLEMMGVSLTVMRLDGELDRLLRRPARSLGMTVVDA